MTRHGVVVLPIPVEVAFDYLVDPRNRPQWQSSLRAVVFPDPDAPHVPVGFGAGTRWIDVTVPGLRPRMQTTVAEPRSRWSETGTWRGFSADLTLEFTPVGENCRVRVEFELRSPRWLLGLGPVLSRMALPMVLTDLRRAGDQMS